MIKIWKEYYLMVIDGEKTAVKRVFTPMLSRWFSADGKEFRSQSHISQIMSQFDEEHKLDVASLYELFKDFEQSEGGDATIEDLNKEAKARKDGDKALQDNLDDEISSRKEAEASINEKLSSEIKERKAADLSMSQSILGETQARTEAVANINKTILMEQEARSEADNALTELVNEAKEEMKDALEKVEGDLEESVGSLSEKDEELSNELEKAVKYEDTSSEANPGRKSIILKNHDNILGYDTEGHAYNLLMLSKWNKVDVGTPDKPFNINGSTKRPTYNDEKELSLLEDIQTALATIQLVKKSDLEYSLNVGDAIVGTINIPEDRFLKDVSFDDETGVLNFTFKAEEGDLDVPVDISALIDTYVNGDGLNLEGNKFSIKIDPSTQAYIEVGPSGLRIKGIDEALAKKVGWQDVSTEDNPNRKAIILENHDTLLGKSTDGSAYNLIMLSKWDKVDVGTGKKPFNINGSDARPTYNDSKDIALLEDVQSAEKKLDDYVKISELPKQLPNPYKLTIKYNGVTAFSYDGSKSETGNFVVNATTVPMSSENNVSISDYFAQVVAKFNDYALKESIPEIPESLPNPNALTIKYNGVTAFTYDGSKAETGNFIVDATTVPMSQEDETTISEKIAKMDTVIAGKASSDEIPTVPSSLPNPNALTIKYNGIVAFTYDGSRPETGNFIVNAETVPMAEGDTTTIAGKFDELEEGLSQYALKDSIPSIPESLPNPNALTIKYNGVTAFTYDGSKAETGNFIVDATTVPMSQDDDTTISAKLEELSEGVAGAATPAAVSEAVAGLNTKLIGDIDLASYLSDPAYTVQVLNKLEQSYIEDLGEPNNVNGQPYNAETNKYIVGNSYLSIAKINESFAFEYDLYALNSGVEMGYLGAVLKAIKLTQDVYDTKIANLESRIAALEGA